MYSVVIYCELQIVHILQIYWQLNVMYFRESFQWINDKKNWSLD